MTPRPIVIGFAIALNLTIFATGIVWLRRQMQRVAAERVATYRALFKLEPLPPPGDVVQVLVEEDGQDMVAELDAVHWPDLGWTDAVTRLRVEGDVLGWRQAPVERVAHR